MKVGVYLSGLGQTYINESVEKYAKRLMNEMSYDTHKIQFELKVEKVMYSGKHQSTVVSIINKEGNQIVYKLYDLQYQNLLVEKFTAYSIFLKNLRLLALVLRRAPIAILRLFVPQSFSHARQTFFVFCIFLLISFCTIMMLPATYTLLKDLFVKSSQTGILMDIKNVFGFGKIDIPYVSNLGIDQLMKLIVSFTAVLVVFIPSANVLITSLATEYVCVNDYLQHGSQKQLVQGHLELLIDHISESNDNPEIHFHTYSFGSILALDYLFPYGNQLSNNAKVFCKSLITIGSPYEFVNAYYPNYFRERLSLLDGKIKWLNVYSKDDALASNFRKDDNKGDAQFGIGNSKNAPLNINYEVVLKAKGSFLDAFLLYGFQVHGLYWDTKTEGQSCLGLIHYNMKAIGII